MQPILFATDGSPSAQKALAEAIRLAKDAGSALEVLTVWQIPIVTAYGYTPSVGPEVIEDEQRRARVVAEAAVKTAEEAGVAATSEIREGDASQEICAAAREHDARLVVIGAHGWGAFKRWIMGSVSTRVVHEAPCPVLVVRMHEEEHDVDVAVAS